MDERPKGSATRTLVLLGGSIAAGILFCVLCVALAPSALICLDFLSGHVPAQARDRFLSRVFEAAVEKDDIWLAKVSQPEVLDAIKAARPLISQKYRILLGDSLAGMYENRIQFDTGAVVYVTYRGQWPTCPDYFVTDDEIEQNLKLTSFRVESR